MENSRLLQKEVDCTALAFFYEVAIRQIFPRKFWTKIKKHLTTSQAMKFGNLYQPNFF